jgi:hypothetical protein
MFVSRWILEEQPDQGWTFSFLLSEETTFAGFLDDLFLAGFAVAGKKSGR